MELGLSARQSPEAGVLRIGNHFVPTRAVASLSSQHKQDQMAAEKISAFVTAVKRD
jgi:hypothetical protein